MTELKNSLLEIVFKYEVDLRTRRNENELPRQVCWHSVICPFPASSLVVWIRTEYNYAISVEARKSPLSSPSWAWKTLDFHKWKTQMKAPEMVKDSSDSDASKQRQLKCEDTEFCGENHWDTVYSTLLLKFLASIIGSWENGGNRDGGVSFQQRN